MTMKPETLIGQFVLCKSAGVIPAGWPARQSRDWYLGSHPALPVLQILASDSTALGWLLGYPIDREGSLVSGAVRFGVSPDSADGAAQFESWLYTYGGRFTAVYLGREASRFYLDPCGSLAAVFCPGREMVASTPSLIPYKESPDREDNHELVRAIEVPDKDAYYPFGLTPRRCVERILPNHFLDLRTWKTVRHWPVGETVVDPDVPGRVGELASILRRNISAIAQRFPLHLSLTAGRDSRMLLACAREHVEKITFFTQTIHNPTGRLDHQVAPRIAKRFGLNHVLLPFDQASEAELKEWTYRTGNCVRGLIAHWIESYKRLEAGRPVLLGAGGEIGRGFHWRRGDTESTPVSVEDLLEKRQIPPTAEVEDRARQWMGGLPIRNTLTLWGLLYNELFNGCWFGPVLYGFVRHPFHIWPFCHRRIVEIMMSLPTEYRRNNLLPVDLVQGQWPELLSVPLNWPMGIRGYLYSLQWRAEKAGRRLGLLTRRGPKK